MSINQAHYQGGLLLYQGEHIINHSKNVTLTFDDKSGQNGDIFRGKHKGKVFVTTHRMIFLNEDQRDHLLSFAVSFMYMKDLRVEQPLLSANYIAGVVAAHPNGGFHGEVNFQLTYSSGGAIDSSAALRHVNSIFHQRQETEPPLYAMAAADLYEPPPPSYQVAQGFNNNFAGTNMYVSPAQAPYVGVYQRQSTGLPQPEFIPQYPETAYQANGANGHMYVPQKGLQQDHELPPSYEQSQVNQPNKKQA